MSVSFCRCHLKVRLSVSCINSLSSTTIASCTAVSPPCVPRLLAHSCVRLVSFRLQSVSQAGVQGKSIISSFSEVCWAFQAVVRVSFLPSFVPCLFPLFSCFLFLFLSSVSFSFLFIWFIYVIFPCVFSIAVIFYVFLVILFLSFFIYSFCVVHYFVICFRLLFGTCSCFLSSHPLSFSLLYFLSLRFILLLYSLHFYPKQNLHVSLFLVCFLFSFHFFSPYLPLSDYFILFVAFCVFFFFF